MILTDCYYFEKAGKAQTRRDCLFSTQSYTPLESCRKGESLWVYIMDNCFTSAGRKAESDLAISVRGGFFFSSIFLGDIERPQLGFGDAKGTEDALLFCVGDESLMVFVARGMKENQRTLFSLLLDADEALVGEMKGLAELAAGRKIEKGFWERFGL